MISCLMVVSFLSFRTILGIFRNISKNPEIKNENALKININEYPKPATAIPPRTGPAIDEKPLINCVFEFAFVNWSFSTICGITDGMAGSKNAALMDSRVCETIITGIVNTSIRYAVATPEITIPLIKSAPTIIVFLSYLSIYAPETKPSISEGNNAHDRTTPIMVGEPVVFSTQYERASI